MKQSFAAHTADPEAPAQETQTALVPQPDNQVGFFGGGGQVVGEVDRSDIKLPRINLVQKSGKLGDEFKPGSIVLAREVLLSDGAQPVNIVLLSIKKQYQEDLPFDENGPTPKLLDTAEEVRAANGSLKYGDDNYYKEIATALVLIEAPAGLTQDQLDAYFYYEAEGKAFCLGLWTFAGSSYNHAGKRLITAGTYGHLREGFSKGNWAFTTEKKTYSGNTYFVPVPKPAGRTTPEFQEWATALVSR